ncbi:hypothetical protein HZ989_09865 [Brevundimonas sp. AJA228-03]|uniref:hypothetical protein n=1 Tax=Brevundimonas sp. AJA228-03 TaxID=2752515 RepID=UPI001AE0B2B6|nr:hypothetical protein [Brevundimonas sp. AJA228-03]QTN18564.1 hypothetical protein HZ989_09865 [Brevundimonas sp. AJA228-03]
MSIPTPVFALEDWTYVWVWSVIMALTFGVFVRNRDLVPEENRRPVLARFLSSLALFAVLWVPSQIIWKAVEQGAEASGEAWPVAWGIGSGILMMAAAFAVLLLAVSRWSAARRFLFPGTGQTSRADPS